MSLEKPTTKEAVQETEENSFEEEPVEIDNFESFLEKRPETALAFIEEYEQKYKRKKWPTEAERLGHLKQFVDEKKIKQQIEVIKNPSAKEKIKRLCSLRLRQEVTQQLDNLNQEKESGNTTKPQIVWTESSERMHGNRGEYHFYYDQLGNTYFKSDETSSSELFCRILSPYFNVQKFAEITLPDGSTTKRVRFLAETSRTVHPDKITGQDCDLIDPMPITDPDKSYASSILINLIGGAYDTVVIKRVGEDGRISTSKNQVLRKDDVFYLFDVTPIFVENERHIKEQLRVLDDFLKNLEPEKKAEIEKYIAETTLFIGSLAKTQTAQESFSLRRNFLKFPARLKQMLADSQIETKAELTENLNKIFQSLQELSA